MPRSHFNGSVNLALKNSTKQANEHYQIGLFPDIKNVTSKKNPNVTN